MAIDILLSGGISAVFGAIALHVANSVVQRRRLVLAVNTEIQENKQKLVNEIIRINNEQNWESVIANRLSTEAYEALKISNPTLFLRLKNEISPLSVAYMSVNKRLLEYDAVNQPGAGISASKEETMEKYTHTLQELQEASEEIDEFVQENIFRRYLYSPALDNTEISIEFDES